MLVKEERCLREKRNKIDLEKINSVPLTLADALGISAGVSTAPDGEAGTEERDDIQPIVEFSTETPLRLSLETKGRKGKTMTALSGCPLHAGSAQALIKKRKHELGCGAAVENDVILFQGDQRQRLFQLLKERAFTRVKVI